MTVQVRPHPVFRRDGNDILITLPITIDEAVLGSNGNAPTLDGPVSVTNPKGASSGRILLLRGRGVVRANSKAGGALIELRIVAPPEIDKGLEEFLQDWRKNHAHDPRKAMREEMPE